MTIQPMYAGERTHALVYNARERWSVSLIWARLETPGLAASFEF